MVSPVRVVVSMVAAVTMVGVAMVSCMPAVTTVMSAVVPTVPAAVPAASQELRDAEPQRDRQDQAVCESFFHRSTLKKQFEKGGHAWWPPKFTI
jgi:hypothetical protein